MADYPKTAADSAHVADRATPHLERAPKYGPPMGGGRAPVRTTGRPRRGR